MEARPEDIAAAARVRPRRWRSAGRGALAAAGAVAAGWAAAYVALPPVLAWYVNRTLDRDPHYDGSIVDVEVGPLFDRYVVHGVEVRVRGRDDEAPLFTASRARLSVQWSALLDGALVGELVLVAPRLNVVRDAGGTEAGQQSDWREPVGDLFPLRINRIAITDGELHYQDERRDPPVDVFVSGVRAEGTNLTNASHRPDRLPSTATLSGHPFDVGAMRVQAAFDPFADHPTFDLDLSVEGLALVELDRFFDAYADFDAEGGTFAAYAELAARDGRFVGYVRPVLRDARILGVHREARRDDDPLRIAWEAAVGGAKRAASGERRDPVAPRVPLSGSVYAPEVGAWGAVTGALYNGLVDALFVGLDEDVQWSDASLPTADDGDERDRQHPRERRREARKERRTERRR